MAAKFYDWQLKDLAKTIGLLRELAKLLEMVNLNSYSEKCSGCVGDLRSVHSSVADALEDQKKE